MLLLLFQLGKDRYALDASQIVEVTPLVDLKKIPAAPSWVAGIFSYRDTAVPVIDMTQLALGRPAQRHIATRIVLVRYPETGAASNVLGVMVEKATETLRRERSDFAEYGLDNAETRYLGPVHDDGQGLIQLIRIADLLPIDVQNLLFPIPVET